MDKNRSIKIEIEEMKEDLNATSQPVAEYYETISNHGLTPNTPSQMKTPFHIPAPPLIAAAESEEVVGVHKRSSTITIAPLMTPHELLQHYFKIVVCDGLPINFMSGLASSALFTTFNQCVGLQSNVEPARLQEMILETAESDRQAIVKELQHRKGLAVIVEEHEENMCAVLVQFYKNMTLQMYVLGVTQARPADSGNTRRLEEAALSVCSRFSIEREMIYTILCPSETVSATVEPPYHLPCLASLLESVIKTVVLEWDLMDKLEYPWDFTAIETFVNKARQQSFARVSAGERKAAEGKLQWLEKAVEVYRGILNPESCRVVTDAVAAVYKLWIQMNKQPGTIAKTFAEELKSNFCDPLMNYEPIRAAMFLDPRIQQLLSAEDKAAAKAHLKALHLQLVGGQEEVSYEVVEEELKGEMDEEEEEEDDDLTVFLKEKTNSSIPSSKIERLLQEFTDVPLLSAKANLLNYWEIKNSVDVQLKDLARVVHASAGVQRQYVDPNFVQQVRQNSWIHSAELQEAIFFVGGNLRMNLVETAGRK